MTADSRKSSRTAAPGRKKSVSTIAAGRRSPGQVPEEAGLREALRSTSAVLHQIADTFYSLDRQWRFTFVNPAAEKAPFGRPASELLGKVIWDLYPDLIGTPIQRHYFDAAENQTLEHYEAQSPLNDRWYEVFMQGREDGVDVYMRDVTRRREAEEALKEGEMKYRTVADFTFDWEFWSGPEGKILYISPSAETILARPVGNYEMMEPLLRDIIHPEDLGARLAHLHEEMKGRGPCDLNFRIIRPDGEVRWIHHVCRPVFDEKGTFLGTRGSNRDITEHHRAEEALKSAEEKYRTLIETTSDFIWETDKDGRYTYCSPQMETLWGLKPEEIIGKTPFDFMPEEDREKAMRLFSALKDAPKPFYRLQSSSRIGADRTVYVEASGVPFFDKDGRLSGCRGITRDITDRRKSEEALKESEEKYRTIVETTNEGIWIFDAERRTTYVNERMAQMLGYTVDEMTGRSYREFVDDESAAISDKVLEERKKGISGSLEFRLKRKDGSDIWTFINAQPIFENDGRFTGSLAMVSDITARKKADEALRQNERRFSIIFDKAQFPIVLSSIEDGRITNVNEQWTRAFGFTREEALGRTSTQLGIIRDGAVHQRLIEDVREKGSLRDLELSLFTKSGKERIVSASLEIIEFGDEQSLISTVRDITEQKVAERGLDRAYKELESRVEERTAELHAMVTKNVDERRRLYDVLETLPAYVCLLDKDYRMPFANRTFRESFGESAGRRCYEFLFNRSEPCETCETYSVMKTRKPHHWFWTGPNGRDYDIYDFPFTDTDGSFMILEMGIDITDRRRAEAAAENANSYNRSLIEASLDPLVTIREDGTIGDVNEATIRVTGYSRQELIGTDFSDYFTEPKRAKEGYKKVFCDGKVTDYPLEIRHRDGRVTPVLYNASVYRDATGKIIGVFAAARDITKRKKAEEELQRAHDFLEKRVKERTAELVGANAKLKEEISQRVMAESLVKKTLSELQAAMEATADGIYAVDHAGRIIRYNQNFASMWNVPEEMLQGGDDHRVTGYLKSQVKNPRLFGDSGKAEISARDRETYDMLELRDGRIFERFSRPQKLDNAIIGRVMSYSRRRRP